MCLVFFFITFDVSFWHPFLCSVLVPHFQPLWRPLIRSDFFTFLWIFWRPFLISVCYLSFQFLLSFLPPPWFLSYSLFGLKILNILAPFLVSFPFSLAPSLLIVSYCHSRVATRVFFFLYPIFFWFLPSFPFLLHIFFPFPSLLLWRTLLFSLFPCFFLFCPSSLAPLLDPRGASARCAPPRIRHCTSVARA